MTGGSGFIGSHLISAADSAGAVVLNLDLRAPRDRNAGEWRDVDLLNAPDLAAAIGEFEPDTIYNLAAAADISGEGDAYRVNTDGLRNLLAANTALPRPPHVIHASTQFVVRPGYQPAHDRDCAPYTEYGETKAKSEEILWTAGSSTPWTIVRPTMVWGPWHPSFARTIWRYIARRWYMMPGGADPIRSYGYVGNVVAQLLRIGLLFPDGARRVFYAGDEPVRSSRWLDGFSQALTGRPVRRVPQALLNVAGRPVPGSVF